MGEYYAAETERSPLLSHVMMPTPKFRTNVLVNYKKGKNTGRITSVTFEKGWYYYIVTFTGGTTVTTFPGVPEKYLSKGSGTRKEHEPPRFWFGDKVKDSLCGKPVNIHRIRITADDPLLIDKTTSRYVYDVSYVGRKRVVWAGEDDLEFVSDARRLTASKTLALRKPPRP